MFEFLQSQDGFLQKVLDQALDAIVTINNNNIIT